MSDVQTDVRPDVPRSAAWRGRVDALSQSQRRALAVVLGREHGAPEMQRLVGFIVPTPGASSASVPTEEALRAFLAERLPDYMIPARFVAVEQLPRTTAGKLDRAALATVGGMAIGATDETPPVHTASREPEPLTDVEATLIDIWRDVLKIDDVGIDDDFFEIGGDSLLSIRVIARAGRAGIRIPPERFFERPTVRTMASGALAPPPARPGADADAGAQVKAAALASPGTATVDAIGDAPLTPIQHWFLDAIPAHRDWWNQGYLLAVGRPLASATCREIVRCLVQRHEALRLQLLERDGSWRQHFPPADEHVPFRVVDVSGVEPVGYAARLSEEADREQQALRLTEGRLFRVILFEGRDDWQRLLLVSHHLVVDGVSWSVILEDLATLVSQALTRQPLQLTPPPAATSARAWAIAAGERAASAAVAAAASYWLSLPMDGGAMPVDTDDRDAGAGVRDGRALVTTNADADVVTLTLDAADTRALLQEAPRRLDASAQSLLLAALALAWRAWSGTDVLWLDLEGHGRDALGHDLDVSRTVGWFTTVFPVRLALPAAATAGAEPETAAVVHSVHRAIEGLPMRGAAHGLLRHLAPDEHVRARLAALPRPTLLFNYLGTHDVSLPAASHLRVTDAQVGRTRSPHAIRPYLLELNASQQQGRLIVAVEYARQLHRPETIDRFVSLLREAMSRVASATPGDQRTAGLDRAGLQAVAVLLGALDEQDEQDELPGRGAP